VADGYAVQHESMAKGATAVEEAATLIGGHLKTLDSEVQTMFGGWNSRASKAFATVHMNWTEQQTKLQTALVDMHTALVSTNQTYQAQEEQESSAFGNIAGQL
jgi:WXG100 family type VII secretion target